jgi:type IV secretion system protein TrbL
MKRLLAFGAVLLLLSAFGAGDALAQVNLNQPDTSVQGLLDLIRSNANGWNGRLHGYAVSLFWSLAAIQFVMTFFPLTIRGADFGEIVGELVRFILTIGFFAALLMYSADWAQAVIDSFRQAGAHAAGLSGTGLQPGDMFATAVELADTIGGVETWNPGTAVAIAVSGLVVLLCFAFIAAFMFVTLVESYIVINASVLFMGFGGSQWTRDYALAILRYAASVGAKLFVLTLIVGLIMQSAHQWQASYNQNDASMWTMVGLALVCAYLSKTIPDLIQGMISGVSPSGGATIGTMAAAALTGGAAGAAAGIAGAAGVAGAASPAGGAAGSSAGGGLAGLIHSSVSGGANMARSAMGSMDGVASAASTIAPRIGGSTASTAAGGLNGSAPSAARVVGSAANAAQGGHPKEQQGRTRTAGGTNGEIAGANRTTSQSASTGAPASAENSSGDTSGPVSQALSGAATGIAVVSHMTAKLASISVPGMEGMAGGIPSLPPSAREPTEDSPFKGDDAPPAPTNTIKPAPATEAHPVPPSREAPPSTAALPLKE